MMCTNRENGNGLIYFPNWTLLQIRIILEKFRRTKGTAANIFYTYSRIFFFFFYLHSSKFKIYFQILAGIFVIFETLLGSIFLLQSLGGEEGGFALICRTCFAYKNF